MTEINLHFLKLSVDTSLFGEWICDHIIYIVGFIIMIPIIYIGRIIYKESERQEDLAEARQKKNFESSQNLADLINNWYMHSLSLHFFHEIPDGISRNIISDAYPFLLFKMDHGYIPIAEHGNYSISIQRKYTTKKELINENSQDSPVN